MPFTLLYGRYYNCVHGTPHLYTCAGGLIFDIKKGTCVRRSEASAVTLQRDCPEEVAKESIAGFSCPEKKVLGPNNLTLIHPSFPYPDDCRKYIICLNSEKPQEAGCFDTMVFDYKKRKCVIPEEFPEW